MASPKRKPPKEVNGVPVYVSGRPTVFKGQTWLTLVPEDDRDERLWEWAQETGRIVQTGGER
jgi:hypothetical protein